MINHTHHLQHTRTRIRPGSMLIEISVALGLLTAIGLFLLKGSLDVMAPRNWIIIQNMADSYLTYEEAYAKRISFDELTDNANSDWTIIDADSPTKPTDAGGNVIDMEIDVIIGKVPGGKTISGKLTRIRIEETDYHNIPSFIDVDDYKSKIAQNPAKMKTWKLQSILTYEIKGQTYHKTRTVIRSQ